MKNRRSKTSFANCSPTKIMRKYLQLAKLTFEEYFVYRLNFILWRFRSLVFFVILFIFKMPFWLPQNPATYLIFLAIIILAVLLYFFISFSLSIAAFWTEEVWATRWLFGIVFLEFFAGALFPIDVLPAALQRIIYLIPFPYLVFFPLKIWLEQVSLASAIQATFICLAWLLFFYWLASFLWRKGAKNYGAYGG